MKRILAFVFVLLLMAAGARAIPPGGGDSTGVPYSGATAPVDLGTQNLTTTGTVSGSNVVVGTAEQSYALPTSRPSVGGSLLSGGTDGSSRWLEGMSDLSIYLDTSISNPTDLGQIAFSYGKIVVGDGAATKTFVPEGTATGGLIFGNGTPNAAGQIGYSGGHVAFHDGSALRQLFDANLAVALLNGSTAVTQATGDTSTKVATDQFVANSIAANNAVRRPGIMPVKKTSTFFAWENYEYVVNGSAAVEVQLPCALDGAGPVGLRNVSANQVSLVPQNGAARIETAMGTLNTAGNKVTCTGAECSGTLYALNNAWYWQPLSGTWSDGGAVADPGAPSMVQHAYAQDSWSAHGSYTAALTGAVTEGNAVIVFADAITGVGGTLTISDSLGNTYVPVLSASQGSTQGGQTINSTMYMWVCHRSKAGTPTVTVTSSISGSIGWGIGVAEFARTARLDGTPGINGQSATSPSITMAGSSDVLIGFLGGANGGSSAATAGSGYTLIDSFGWAGNTCGFHAWEYKIVSASGSDTASFGSTHATNSAGVVALRNF